MKANELMIGDWVSYRKDFPDRVNAIAIGGHAVSLEHDSWQQMSSIQPIPLTPEILEKNGIHLEEVGDNGTVTPAKWRNRFEKWSIKTTWKDAALWYDRTAKYWHLHDMGAAKIHFVHELQHALLLAGIEKEVTL